MTDNHNWDRYNWEWDRYNWDRYQKKRHKQSEEFLQKIFTASHKRDDAVTAAWDEYHAEMKEPEAKAKLTAALAKATEEYDAIYQAARSKLFAETRAITAARNAAKQDAEAKHSMKRLPDDK